jgi:Alpha/beta hydrolase domain
MLKPLSPARFIVVLLVFAALVAGCSDDDDASDPDGEAVTFTGVAPEEVAPPPAEGEGPSVPQPAAPLPEGYVMEEVLLGGTATSFTVDDTPQDGHWAATPGDEDEFRTRVIVRRPESAEDFSGTVLVEWFNVSAIEASPDWAFMSEEIGREGHAYIGVSAQAQGVEGGDTLLDVEVDPEAAEEAGATVDTSGLKNIDPDRYGTLVHPGDAYAFDIFAQVGRAVAESPDELLGGFEASNVIAIGESQSAAFLSTFVNAVHPLDPVFDGYLIHSRGGGTAPIDGDLIAARSGENEDAFRRSGVQIRTDLDVPVFIFETETDLTLLGYASARQDDSELVRTWEVAGLSHADAHFIRAIVGGPRDPSVGDLLGCTEPINVGPQHEVIQAALHHVVAWVADGEPPPAGTAIELTDDEETTIARDDHGIALGGVRHPLVDVPTATLSGDPPGGLSREDGGVCFLFGTTTAFTQETLLELYDSADDYIAAFTESADEAVADGFLLRPDADALIAEAEENRALFE